MLTSLFSSKSTALFSRLFLLMMVLATLAYQQRGDGRLHILFPALKGDAMIIQLPDGEFMLIDGGAEPSALSAALGRAMPYWKRNLAVVVLTSKDSRHLPGQVAALAHYKVARAYAHPDALQGSGATLREWQRLLREQAVAPTALYDGQHIVLGAGLGLSVQLSGEGCVLRLDYGRVSAVFAHSAALEQHQQSLAKAAQLVVFPWEYEPRAPMLQSLQPQALVYSDGMQADEPVRLSLHDRRIGKVVQYHEALHGSIEWVSDGRGVWVKTEKLAWN